MVALKQEPLQNLLASNGGPCLTLLQPTVRTYPDNQQNAIRFKNLVRSLEESVKEKYPAHDAQNLLQPFHELEQNDEFWMHSQDGLAVLADPQAFRVYQLPQTVPELAVAADSFHIKPLIRHLQASGRFQVLCLDRDKARMFEGDRHALTEIELPPDFPATLEDALGTELTERHTTPVTHSRAGGPRQAASMGPTFRHGQGSKKDEVDIDIRRFFNIVDREVTRHFSNPSRLPLVLFSLPEYQTEFRNVSENRFLLPEGVAKGPGLLNNDQIRDEAWSAIEPYYARRLDELKEGYEVARARGLASKDLYEIGQALSRRRVGTLLIDESRRIPGRFDPATGQLALDDAAQEDLLDALAEETLRTGGDVLVIPADQMPTDSGAAAIYRF